MRDTEEVRDMDEVMDTEEVRDHGLETISGRKANF